MNKLFLAFFIGVLFVKIDSISIKYRRWCSPWKFCSFTSWREWEPCDKTCGGGFRMRYRQMCSLPVIDFTQHVAMCHRKFEDFIQYESCSQTCSPYGNWSDLNQRCECEDLSISDSCCTTDHGRWSDWSVWSKCGARCGNHGVRNRTRTCLWKKDLILRDTKNSYCTGNHVQYESCLNSCDETDYDHEYYEKLPTNITAHLGKHAQFGCKQKAGTIKWLINDQDVAIVSIQNPSIRVVSNGTILFIFPVTKFFSSETRITCRINLSSNEHIDRHAWLTLDSNNELDDQTSAAQCGLLKPLEPIYYVRFGSSFSIQCQPKTNNATIIWQKNGMKIHHKDSDEIQILTESMLFINEVDFRHNASFSCTLQTTLKCKHTSYWTLIVFETTQQVSDIYQPTLLNFVGTHGFVLSGSSPWHVTISYRDLSANFNYEAFCSGLLIDEDTILSVSRCFHSSSSLQIYLNQQNILFDPRKLIVYVSKYDRLSSSIFERQSSVINIVNSTTDIVILKVHLLYLSSEARPLPLATMANINSLIDNVTIYVTGWGPMAGNAEKPLRLKYVQQRLTPCNDSSTPMTLCTIAVAGKQPNLCPGDTGGVLFAQFKHQTFAVGLVSRFSKAFCDMRSTQVTTFLRLDTIHRWLRENSLM